jgi:hypothetical protein
MSTCKSRMRCLLGLMVAATNGPPTNQPSRSGETADMESQLYRVKKTAVWGKPARLSSRLPIGPPDLRDHVLL